MSTVTAFRCTDRSRDRGELILSPTLEGNAYIDGLLITWPRTINNIEYWPSFFASYGPRQYSAILAWSLKDLFREKEH